MNSTVYSLITGVTLLLAFSTCITNAGGMKTMNDSSLKLLPHVYGSTPLRMMDERHIKPGPPPPNSVVPLQFYHARLNCNKHPYNYVINKPRLCIDFPNLFLLVMIRTNFSFYEHRMAIRETWAAREKFGKLHVKFVFLFGMSSDIQTRRAILRESHIYDDILQSNFQDSYTNLTIKNVMAWKWVAHFCPNAKFVMLVDDMVIVDVVQLIAFLHEQRTDDYDVYNSFILCYLRSCCESAHRNKTRYVSKTLTYPGSFYPQYCYGAAYVATPGLLSRLYLMSRDTPAFAPADVWTGVVAEMIGAKFRDSKIHYTRASENHTHGDYASHGAIVGVLGAEYTGRESVAMRSLWEVLSRRYDTFQSDARLHALDRRSLRTDAETRRFIEGSVYSIKLVIYIDIVAVLFLVLFLMYRWPRVLRFCHS